MWLGSAVRVHTRDMLEPYHDVWKDVDANDKKLIHKRMANLMESNRATQMSQSASDSSSSVIQEDTILQWVLVQFSSEYQSWINSMHVNHKNLYANQIMHQAISQLFPNLRFALVIRPMDLVPPGPSTNPSPLQADDDADDDDATDLGN
ncbi:hypothetical protein TIFTF001_039677 [Ficus carica]|uniref:Uncharacterized protein n=1 Tax=Ficus carica TaxID=3494 RepID=A0AA88EA82_FICCA|nr:hypothetical protein TIFTF001_039677 [Ficus carica]